MARWCAWQIAMYLKTKSSARRLGANLLGRQVISTIRQVEFTEILPNRKELTCQFPSQYLPKWRVHGPRARACRHRRQTRSDGDRPRAQDAAAAAGRGLPIERSSGFGAIRTV